MSDAKTTRMELTAPSSVTGAPRIWLRLEGTMVLLSAVILYALGGYSWIWFAACFLLPDVAFIGYAFGPRVGAAIYNCLHSYVVPLAVAMLLLTLQKPMWLPIVWMAHIGFDRSLGYGLKYPTAFGDTHLGIQPGKKKKISA
jgi:hypothetical protein